MSQEKKSADEIREEIRKLQLKLHQIEGSKPLDLSSLEQQVEQEKLNFGQERLTAELNRPEPIESKACPKCKKNVRVREKLVPRTVITLSGPVKYQRHRHYCDRCKLNFYPRDEELDLLEKGQVSPELEKKILDFGINDPFASGTERFNFHHSVKISSTLMKRVVERVGQEVESSASLYIHDVVSEENRPPLDKDDTLIVQVDGSMLRTREEHWREAKVAVIYRQSQHLSHRESNRGIISEAHYASVLDKQVCFKEELEAALESAAWSGFGRLAFLGDGALGNWNLGSSLLPQAIQILDYAHAVEHAMDAGKILLEEDNILLKLWNSEVQRLLISGQVALLIEQLKECIMLTGDTEGLKAINNLVRYYRNNEERMNYGRYLNDNLPIGTGAVESAHKHVLQARMKRAGQSWSLSRAKRMVRMRALYKNTGPDRFRASIRKANLRTRQEPIQTKTKRRASNR